MTYAWFALAVISLFCFIGVAVDLSQAVERLATAWENWLTFTIYESQKDTSEAEPPVPS